MMVVPFASPIPSALVDPGASQPIVVRRPQGHWVGNGLWGDDANGTVNIRGRGIVYPSTPDDLVALPEGERTVKSVTLYWAQRFQMNDRLKYEGEEYRIVHIAPWQRYGYQMAIAQVNQIDE